MALGYTEKIKPSNEQLIYHNLVEGNLRGVVVNVLDSDVVVNKFEFQSCFAQSVGAVEYTNYFSAEV